MTKRFDYFVVFAEMRTGSNFLEANLNAFPGLTCLGEAFNPHFIGYPNREDCLGISEEARNSNPNSLLDVVKVAHSMAGFRFFHNHDSRILETVLNDPRCAKIILTRNPAESYVSWKIAQATGQWKLTNVQKRKEAKAVFDAKDFEAHLEALQAFQVTLLNALQITGQTAFYVAYEDLQNVDVMNGLAMFLEQPDRLEHLDKSLKRQNPSPISQKVENFGEMEAALAGVDRFNLTRTPNFEPRRGAAVPAYIACETAPLLYLPIRSGPEEEICDWMAALDHVDTDALLGSFNQKGLRQWKRKHKGHRSFTMLRHPVVRAHAAFCDHILLPGPKCYPEIRKTLRRVHKLPIPGGMPGPDYTRDAHRTAFLAFLDFVKANLAGQTAVRNDPAWGTQSGILQGMGNFSLPDFILREDEMQVYLPALAQQVGYDNPPEPSTAKLNSPYTLAEIYDAEVEARVMDAYQRDYVMFGFDRWA